MDSETTRLNWELIEKAHKKFLDVEPRDLMYKVSTRLIEDYWGNDEGMSNALGVLLLTWNSGFYRYGKINFDAIQDTISKNKDAITRLRSRDITTYHEDEKYDIGNLYEQFLDSLKITIKSKDNKEKEARSPVGVAKALHLLCPKFFPLWDNKISKGYRCKWPSSEKSFDYYWKFLGLTANQVRNLESDRENEFQHPNLSTLKLVDEYNYVHFTLKMI